MGKGQHNPVRKLREFSRAAFPFGVELERIWLWPLRGSPALLKVLDPDSFLPLL